MSAVLNVFVNNLLMMFYIVPIGHDYSTLKQVPEYVLDAIPFFLLFILIEWIVSLFCKKTVYSFKDFIMSLSLGTVQQLFIIWLKTLKIVPYIIIYQYSMPIRQRIADYLPVHMVTPFSSPLANFLLGLLGCDLCYYIFHRLAHEYHIIWTGHGVHHSGERYNFATALRQGVLQSVFAWVVYLPLAVIGLNPIEYIRHDRLNTVYQFWIHTEFIGRLPLLFEMIMNTPSHHRMHHHPPGNCNYAGVFIIWDRIFGTFIPEYPSKSSSAINSMHSKPSSYGLAKPLDSFDPVFANFSHMYKIYESQNKASSNNNDMFKHVKLLLRVCGFMVKKRVESQWCINLSMQSLFPDIDANTTFFDYISFRHFAQVPVYSDEVLSNKNDDDANVKFIQQRSKREGGSLSMMQKVVTIVHVLVTMVASLFILIKCKHIYDRSPAGLIFSSAACVVSFQAMRMHY